MIYVRFTPESRHQDGCGFTSACDPKRTFKGAFSNRRDLPFMGPTWRIGYLPSSPHETGLIGRAIYNSRSKPPSPAASMHPPRGPVSRALNLAKRASKCPCVLTQCLPSGKGQERPRAKSLKLWCPGAESNHRHADFQFSAPISRTFPLHPRWMTTN